MIPTSHVSGSLLSAIHLAKFPNLPMKLDIEGIAASILVLNVLIKPVIFSTPIFSIILCSPFITVDFICSQEPLNVSVEVAALTAPSFIPNCTIAWLNSFEEISPFSIASRKLPVYAPFFNIASCNSPEAPGIASAN